MIYVWVIYMNITKRKVLEIDKYEFNKEKKKVAWMTKSVRGMEICV